MYFHVLIYSRSTNQINCFYIKRVIREPICLHCVQIDGLDWCDWRRHFYYSTQFRDCAVDVALVSFCTCNLQVVVCLIHGFIGDHFFYVCTMKSFYWCRLSKNVVFTPKTTISNTGSLIKTFWHSRLSYKRDIQIQVHLNNCAAHSSGLWNAWSCHFQKVKSRLCWKDLTYLSLTLASMRGMDCRY